MSTVDRPGVRTLPPLVAGQRLDQPTFHERYEAMPPGTRAELIGGVVSMPSPMSYEHDRRNNAAIFMLTYYEGFTPGVEALGGVTTILGIRGEVQPDAMLRILPECGGRTRPVGDYVGGSPELVVEVSLSTRRKDLGPKLRDYDRAGVLEYLVSTTGPDDFHRYALRDGRLIREPLPADGLFQSEVFPGLWLDPAALRSRDFRGMMATLDRGIATPEHAAFAARLAAARRGD